MDIILLLAGLVLLFKKQISVSKTRVISGKPVKILGVLCVLPFLYNLVTGFISKSSGAVTSATNSQISLGLIILAVVAVLGVVIFYKPKNSEVGSKINGQ